MSAILEWSGPFTLTSPAGDLDLSADTGYRFIPDQCEAGQEMILQKRQISGADGEIFSRRFKSGYTARITLELLDGSAIAVGSGLVSAWDALLLHLDALLNPSLADLVSSCRLTWTPSGSSDDWMLDRIRLLERPKPAGILPKIVTFAVDTELPYALRANDETANLLDGVALNLDNSLSTARQVFPVYKVYGPTTGFTIVNTAALDPNGNPLQIVYDDTLPGGAAIAGGDYVEINCFRETVVLNGDESFDSIANIDIPISDLRLPLVPGINPITITGADADLIWQPARA
jgi:hypothetical protein